MLRVSPKLPCQPLPARLTPAVPPRTPAAQPRFGTAPLDLTLSILLGVIGGVIPGMFTVLAWCSQTGKDFRSDISDKIHSFKMRRHEKKAIKQFSSQLAQGTPQIVGQPDMFEVQGIKGLRYNFKLNGHSYCYTRLTGEQNAQNVRWYKLESSSYNHLELEYRERLLPVMDPHTRPRVKSEHQAVVVGEKMEEKRPSSAMMAIFKQLDGIGEEWQQNHEVKDGQVIETGFAKLQQFEDAQDAFNKLFAAQK